MLEDVVKFISSPEVLSSTFTFTVACPIHFVFFSYILFTFTSFLLDFVSLNKLIALLVELKMIIFGNYSLSLMRNVTWGKKVFHVSQDKVK